MEKKTKIELNFRLIFIYFIDEIFIYSINEMKNKKNLNKNKKLKFFSTKTKVELILRLILKNLFYWWNFYKYDKKNKI